MFLSKVVKDARAMIEHVGLIFGNSSLLAHPYNDRSVTQYW